VNSSLATIEIMELQRSHKMNEIQNPGGGVGTPCALSTQLIHEKSREETFEKEHLKIVRKSSDKITSTECGTGTLGSSVSVEIVNGLRKDIAESLVDSSSEDEPLPNPKHKEPSSKTVNRQKNTKKISKMNKTASSRSSKKGYVMPGQKKDTPGELDGGRIFYESLRKQNPKSKMAEE